MLPSTNAPRIAIAIAIAPMLAKMKALMTRPLYSYCPKRRMYVALDFATSNKDCINSEAAMASTPVSLHIGGTNVADW